MLGRDPKTDSKNFKSWNKSAVVIDVWDGHVFPTSEIPERLKAYVKYGDPHVNINIPFQMPFHEILPYSKLVLSPSLFLSDEINRPSEKTSPLISNNLFKQTTQIQKTPVNDEVFTSSMTAP